MKTSLFILGPVAVSAAIMLSASAYPQTTTPVDTSKGPEATSGMGKYDNYDRMAASQRGGMAFMGRVTVEGGTLPWDPIPILVTCNGQPRYNTQTDAKGGFAIKGERVDSEVAAVKSNKGQATASQLAGCEVRASLAGYHSSIVRILNGNIMDNPDIGAVRLTIDEHASGSASSTTTASAPKDAAKKFDKARSEWLDQNPGGAERDLDKAVQIDPQFAEAWYQLAKLQEKSKPQEALNSYQKAAAADPQFISPYEHIAALAAQQQKWQQAADATAQSLKLVPAGSAGIWYLDAVANFNLGKKDVAEESAKKSLAMDPQHVAPNTEQLLAVMLAGKGEYAAALQHLRNCLTYMPAGPNADLMKQQIAQLEKMAPDAK